MHRHYISLYVLHCSSDEENENDLSADSNNAQKYVTATLAKTTSIHHPCEYISSASALEDKDTSSSSGDNGSERYAPEVVS